MKSLLTQDGHDFWKYLSKEYPVLRSKFPKGTTLTVISNDFVILPPKDLTPDETKEMERIKSDWLVSHGFETK